MDQEAKIKARIRDAILKAGGVSSVAQETAIPEGTLKKYVAMSSMASFENASRIAKAARIALDDLAGDQLPNMDYEGSNFIRLPMYPEKASAGSGIVKIDEIYTSFMSFEERWLRDLGATPGACFLVTATGDSMFPTIPDGAAMICDGSKTEVQNGFVYAFDVDGDLIVKRAERLLDGTVDLISDNREKYPPRNYKASAVKRMHVLGRIMYVGRPL